MWAFTEFGFFSAVQHRDRPETVLVRGRFKEDIGTLAKMARDASGDKSIRLRSTPEADYPYRVIMPKDLWARLLAAMAQEIDYDNFKNHVHGEPDRDRALMAIWAALFDAGEEREPRPIKHLPPSRYDHDFSEEELDHQRETFGLDQLREYGIKAMAGIGRSCDEAMVEGFKRGGGRHGHSTPTPRRRHSRSPRGRSAGGASRVAQ